MKKTTFILLFLLVFQDGNAQLKDSVRTLHAEEVLLLVRKFHPIAKQAVISIEKADADIRIARAAFDPVLRHTASEKTFNNLDYYHYNTSELSIPTWYGIEIFGGLETLSGNRTDPTLTPGESNFIGIQIPLAKNLLMDKRRALLQQAKIFSTMALTEQQAVLNDLSIEAMYAYWNWVKSYQKYKVLKNTVEINKKRMTWIRNSWMNGERPMIDTIEALTQLQTFQVQEQNNWMEFQNAGLYLSTFLWQTNNEPYNLPDDITPANQWNDAPQIVNFNLDLNSLLQIGGNQHPYLSLYDQKINILEIDKKLKFQELLPKVDLKYRHLSKGNSPSDFPPPGVLRNNFQYTLSLEIPLRLSQGRGEFEKAKLKIEETELDYARKRQEIALKIKACYNEFMALQSQIDIQNIQYNNLQFLVRAEELKFQNGESSLFLINSRENKALEASQKLIELKTEYYKTLYALQWSAGLLQY